jgi:hypothetical protein
MAVMWYLSLAGMIFDDTLRAEADGASPMQDFVPDSPAILTSADDMKKWLASATPDSISKVVDNCVRGRVVGAIDFSGRNQSMRGNFAPVLLPCSKGNLGNMIRFLPTMHCEIVTLGLECMEGASADGKGSYVSLACLIVLYEHLMTKWASEKSTAAFVDKMRSLRLLTRVCHLRTCLPALL